MSNESLTNQNNLNAPTEPQASAPAPVVKNKNPNGKSPAVKFIALGVLFIFGISLIAAAYFMGQKSKTENTTLKDNSINSSSPAPDSNADSKTYINTKYGFSFTYPKNWINVESESNEIVFPSLSIALRPSVPAPGDETYGLITVNIYENRYDSVQDFCNGNCANYKNIKISNIPAIKGENVPGPIPSDIIIFQYKNNIYRIILGIDKSYEESLSITQKQKILDQILSTFKFTDSNTQPTTQDYLEIPELGIKIPLDGTIKDLIYYPETLDGKNIAHLSTSALAKDGGQYCSAKESPSGSISIVKKAGLTDNPDNPWWNRLSGLKEATSSDPIQAKEFPDFFILYTSPQATCSDKQNINNLQSTSIKAISQAIPNIELLK